MFDKSCNYSIVHYMVIYTESLNKPKHPVIAAQVRQRVETGEYTGKIPGERALASEFGVHVITVNKAITSLVKKGLLRRVRGKGTFVNHSGRPEAAVKPLKSLVNLYLPCTAHTFSDFAANLRARLLEKRLLCAVVDTNAEMISKQDYRLLEQAMCAQQQAAIVFGFANFPFELLNRHQEHFRNLVFVFSRETEQEFEAHSVFTDAWYGGYIATRHLLGMGHARILLRAHVNQVRASLFRYSLDGQVIQGYIAALEEAGLAHLAMIDHVPTDPDRDDAALKKRFAANNPPTAIFATADFLAIRAWRILTRMGLRVPRDLAMVGYYDTPWCEQAEVPLTSVRVREEEIARIAADKARATERASAPILVKPELVVRKSCGSPVPAATAVPAG